MTRATSREAYFAIKENGLLSRRRFQFYHVIFHHGPITANQAARLVESEFKITMSNSGIGSRLSELARLGVVTVVGKQKDEKTGMTNYVWQATDKLPLKFDKPKQRKCPTCKGTGKITEEQAMFDL